jgi:hypothetical protein
MLAGLLIEFSVSNPQALANAVESHIASVSQMARAVSLTIVRSLTL